jgi:hypothetical protein
MKSRKGLLGCLSILAVSPTPKAPQLVSSTEQICGFRRTFHQFRSGWLCYFCYSPLWGVARDRLAASRYGTLLYRGQGETIMQGIGFEVAAKHRLGKAGTDTHTRFIVDNAKTPERLRAKAARSAALKS